MSRTLDSVTKRVSSREYTDKDVDWLIMEVNRYRNIDKAMNEILRQRNGVIAVQRDRIHDLEDALVEVSSWDSMNGQQLQAMDDLLHTLNVAKDEVVKS